MYHALDERDIQFVGKHHALVDVGIIDAHLQLHPRVRRLKRPASSGSRQVRW